MAVTIELQNTGQAAKRSEIIASIEHAFDGRAGEWHVSILRSHENDDWELTIGSPEGFEPAALRLFKHLRGMRGCEKERKRVIGHEYRSLIVP